MAFLHGSSSTPAYLFSNWIGKGFLPIAPSVGYKLKIACPFSVCNAERLTKGGVSVNVLFKLKLYFV